MKNQSLPHLFYGLAAGLFIWSLHELILQLIKINILAPPYQIVLSGSVFGIIFGIVVLLKDGFLFNNFYKIKRGALFGGVLGLLGGIISYFIVEQALNQIPAITENMLLSSSVLVFQWLILALFVGLASSVRDGSSALVVRNLIIGAISGIIAGIIFSLTQLLDLSAFWSRGIGILVFATGFSLAAHYLSRIRRTSWLKGLNGKLEGIDFELSKDIHFLGTQSNDDINLKSYQEIRPTHAKLIKYYSGYSLVDNDPFWQTFVNFRNIKEQPLKNGDIVKIGQALFQYCSVD